MLTGLVHKIEAMEGILADWSIAGAHTESAAYEVARTVCRRAERAVVRFVERRALPFSQKSSPISTVSPTSFGSSAA